MKGHNYGLCRKCGETHVHPKGMLNKHHSDTTKEKIGAPKKDKTWEEIRGVERARECKENLSKANIGEKNPNWTGGDGYGAVHEWVRKRKPKPLLCEICGEKKKLELANISGDYKKDIDDFKWTCKSCNMKMHIPKHPRFKTEAEEKERIRNINFGGKEIQG